MQDTVGILTRLEGYGWWAAGRCRGEGVWHRRV